MFGRRRHRAPVIVAPPAPVPIPGVELSEEQLFEKVRSRLDQHLGTGGDWTLVRRSDADTDAFFHEMAAFSLAREITAAIVANPAVSSADQAPVTPAHAAPTITVQTVPSGTSGLTDLDSSFTGTTAAAETVSTEHRDVVEHVMFELNTVAVWADPQRHDPAQVDAEMVTPSGTSRRRWNGTRAS